MSWYEEDFFDEPNEFEMMVTEFKQSLYKSVKEELKLKLASLEKENEELQTVKKDFEQIKREYEDKKRKLEYEYQNLKNNVRRERLSELMKDIQTEMYSVATRREERPKCNKCDEERKLHFTTPLGNKTYEWCTCSNPKYLYEPIPVLMSSFKISRDNTGVAWYKVRNYDGDERLEYCEDSISQANIIKNESEFNDNIYSRKALFKTRELAQKFCDFKNKDN